MEDLPKSLDMPLSVDFNRFIDVFLGRMQESELGEDEYKLYKIFYAGIIFSDQFQMVMAAYKVDPETGKELYAKLFRPDPEPESEPELE